MQMCCIEWAWQLLAYLAPLCGVKKPRPAMARMRDKLIHHYFGVDYSMVWNTGQESIPALEQQRKKRI